MDLWKINTSNRNKFEELQHYFSVWGKQLEPSHIDLKEIDADPITVITHKAGQLEENVIVEDTSLEIEGATVGIHVRWLLDHLQDYIGRKATWLVLLAYHQGDEVFLFRGYITGVIVSPRGTGGFGFDRVFLPDGATQTLAEAKPDKYNARAMAVEAIVKGNIWTRRPVIKQWNGPWQNNG